MSIPKMANAMDHIDDDLVSGAVEYKRTRKKNSWIKWGAVAACLCLMLVAFPVIQNLTHTQEADTIELVEVSKWSIERVEKKLIGEYRGNILHSWGEPDAILTETSDKYYLEDDNSRYIILCYDSNGNVVRLSQGRRTYETVEQQKIP